ncbi:MAG: phosphoribosyl-AMP cyclohydrolase [Acidobacteria bacterium]|nr:phosphoribosyl-AMP cyclohydrolase [Acidobacteriota bacterium]
MDYSKLNGLIPAVVQDAESGEVLMVGFMNEAALAETRRSGFATFFSRTRQELWTKGATSGNRLAVKRLLVDCDDDTLLVQVTRLGDGVTCHTGQRSCFFRDLPLTERIVAANQRRERKRAVGGRGGGAPRQTRK